MGKGATIPPLPWGATVSRALLIPDDPYWIATITGLLVAATKPYYWNPQTGDVDAATEQVNQIIYSWPQAVIVAPIYRIDPSNSCIIQVSDDGGTTWSTFIDISACIPAPPDVSHFLVDNPGGATRSNNVVASGAFPAIFLQSDGYPSLVVQSAFGDEIAYLHATNASSDNEMMIWQLDSTHVPGFLQLRSPFGVRQAISYEHMWLAPQMPALSGSNRTRGGIYLASDDEYRPHVGTFIAGGTEIDKALEYELTLTASYAPGTSGAHPYLVVTKTGDTWNIEIVSSSTQPPLNPTAHISTLASGATPTFVKTFDGTNLDYALGLPPIDPTTNFTEHNVTGTDPYLPPSLTLIESLVDGVRTEDYRLTVPPDATLDLPESGTKHFKNIVIDAFGSTLPFMIPSGYSIDSLTTSGLWYFQRFLEAGSKWSNGVHTTDHDWPYYCDLTAQVSTGTADSDGFYIGESALFDIISDGFLASEDCFIKLEQSFHFTDGERKGYITCEFDVTAPAAPIYDWDFDFNFVTAEHADVWTAFAANGNDPRGWQSGQGVISGISGWIVGVQTHLNQSADSFLEVVDIYCETLFPGSSPTGNELQMPDAGITLTDPSAVATASGHTAFSAIHQNIRSGPYTMKISSVSYDHSSGSGNDQNQTITRIRLRGNGATPIFTP